MFSVLLSLLKRPWLIVAAGVACLASLLSATALAAPMGSINEAISRGHALFTQPSFGGKPK